MAYERERRTTPAGSKKRRAPRAAFVVTVSATAAVVAVAAGGCGELFDDDVTSNPPSPCPATSCLPEEQECPQAQPSPGESCSAAADEVCSYGQGDGCEIDLACENGAWVDRSPSCNPPPPFECPDEPPLEGESCWEIGATCTWWSPDGCEETVGTCGGGSVWQLEHYVPECNPPAPECPPEVPAEGGACEVWDVCEYTLQTPCGEKVAQALCDEGSWDVVVEGCDPAACPAHADEAVCSSDPTCVWLVPGCGEPPLGKPGCFTVGGCSLDADCPEGLFCQEAWFDPCYGSSCDACGEAAKLCLPG